jgi:hypothetical protein
MKRMAVKATQLTSVYRKYEPEPKVSGAAAGKRKSMFDDSSDEENEHPPTKKPSRLPTRRHSQSPPTKSEDGSKKKITPFEASPKQKLGTNHQRRLIMADSDDSTEG